jgi:hypothetical protein
MSMPRAPQVGGDEHAQTPGLEVVQHLCSLALAGIAVEGRRR